MNDWRNLSRKLRNYNWLALLSMIAASSFLTEADFTIGLAAGGLLSMANFAALSRSVVSAFGQQGFQPGLKAAIIFKYYLRLAAMGIIIWVLVSFRWVNPVGLAVGLSLVVLSIVAVGIVKAINMSSREAV